MSMYRYEYVPLYTSGGFWLNNSDSQHRECRFVKHIGQ